MRAESGSTRGSRAAPRSPPPAPPGCAGRARPAARKRLQLEHVLREHARPPRVARRSARSVSWSVPGARPRPRSMRPGKSARQRAELLGDHVGRVVRQHDAAGADADRLRAGGDVGDHDRGRGARDAGHVVVLGDPEAAIAQCSACAARSRALSSAPRASVSSVTRTRSRIERGVIARAPQQDSPHRVRRRSSPARG